jgi:hypothetical protein
MKVIVELIEDLNDYDDVDPTPGSGTKEVMAPPNSKHVLPHAGTDRCRAGSCRQASGMAGEYPVLCVAARRVLDESASRMLSQHSRKARRGARVISSDAVSRGAIGELDLGGVAMVCVSYLNSSGTMAPLATFAPPDSPTVSGSSESSRFVVTGRAALGHRSATGSRCGPLRHITAGCGCYFPRNSEGRQCLQVTEAPTNSDRTLAS